MGKEFVSKTVEANEKKEDGEKRKKHINLKKNIRKINQKKLKINEFITED
jgi:hypothetical protein